LAGLVAVLVGIHALQASGIFPYISEPFRVLDLSFWSFLMWGLLVWVYVLLTQMLDKITSLQKLELINIQDAAIVT